MLDGMPAFACICGGGICGGGLRAMRGAEQMHVAPRIAMVGVLLRHALPATNKFLCHAEVEPEAAKDPMPDDAKQLRPSRSSVRPKRVGLTPHRLKRFLYHILTQLLVAKHPICDGHCRALWRS